MDGAYYSFLSLTTIGFGDIVAGNLYAAFTAIIIYNIYFRPFLSYKYNTVQDYGNIYYKVF